MTCAHCGAAFESPTGWPRKYCKPKCKNAACAEMRKQRNAAKPERRCYRCKETKPAAEFGGPSKPYCTPCMNTYARERNARQPVEEKRLRRRRQYERVDPAVRRAYARRRRWGLSDDDRAEMLRRQGGGCGICRDNEPGGRGTWHVDHDHACCPGDTSCGKCIRGLLCSRCNVGLGNFRDNPELLIIAASYLRVAPPKAA
jgi:hypothetical protein